MIKKSHLFKPTIYQILIILLLFFIPRHTACAQITYNLSGGRFGDNLLAYTHAKWLSHIYDIELAYKPFEYSDQLVLHHQEKKLNNSINKLKTIRLNQQTMTIEPNQKTLYTVPYFSDFKNEHEIPINKKNWIYFEVNWENIAFNEKIKTMISPNNKQILKFNIPKNKISVAVHVREGGGFDPMERFKADPLKFPPESYNIEQVKKISELFNHKDLYVFIFTDHKNPSEIVYRFKQALTDYPYITFDCNEGENNYKNNTLSDFFALLKFDCLIRPLSNFSFVASKLTDYCIEIAPRSWHENNGAIIIDSVNIAQKPKNGK